MNRNVKLFPFYEVFFNIFAWAPVFFLYFAERVSLQEVLQLHAFYYICVVILEVPSGFFSDQFGRKRTLTIASLGIFASNTVFYFGETYLHLAIAQFLMAMGYSFYSGTNSSFHYESLKELNRVEEFRDREARIAGLEMLSSALGIVLGGFLATFSLKNAYGLTAATAFVTLIISLFFVEPRGQRFSRQARTSFFEQLAVCARALKNRDLAWVSGFMVLFTVVVHVPSEFFQPYVDLLNIQMFNSKSSTPLIVALVMATSSLLAAGFAAKSSVIAGRFGSEKVFLFTIFFEVLLMGLMAAIHHVFVFVLLLMRRIPESLVRAPYTTEINTRIESEQRATFFSINSLVGRLSYSLLLFVFSFAYGYTDQIDALTLSNILYASALIGFVGWMFLFVSRRKLARLDG